jgi:hypothetical protein
VTDPDYGADMDLKKLSRHAKRYVDQRGGSQALQADAKQVQAVLHGRGTAKDKAKAVADVLRSPSSARRDRP